MENSKMQKEVLNLGKLLVKELKLERGSNTFSRWVAHYIAGKMKQCQGLTGNEKKKAEKECYDAILKLWEHRWLLPNGNRPLEDFAPIINLLQKLNPEKENPYFFPTLPTIDKGRKKGQSEVGTTQFWVDVAEQIDKTARIWLSAALNQAAVTATSSSTKAWLQNAVKLPHNHDSHIIEYIIDDISDEDLLKGRLRNKKQIDKKYQIEYIKSRIAELEKFSKLNEFLINHYKVELSKAEPSKRKRKEK